MTDWKAKDKKTPTYEFATSVSWEVWDPSPSKRAQRLPKDHPESCRWSTWADNGVFFDDADSTWHERLKAEHHATVSQRSRCCLGWHLAVRINTQTLTTLWDHYYNVFTVSKDFFVICEMFNFLISTKQITAHISIHVTGYLNRQQNKFIQSEPSLNPSHARCEMRSEWKLPEIWCVLFWLPFFIPSTSFCSLSSWFTSSSHNIFIYY